MPFMPKPGIMVHLSPEYTPAYLKGIVIHPENALKFDFIIYKGDKPLSDSQKREEYTKLTKYFLASLAIPDDDQWVNLSPYEKDRIIKDDFGKTEMGRDLLAQDYMLKQITASLIYPEDNLGKKFWDKVYTQAQKQYGTTNIPVNTFNKVWILPDDALIYEKDNIAYVLKNHLRVMLEEDYLSLQKHSGISTVIPAKAGIHNKNNTHTIASKIVKEIVLPELQREVNEDQNFAALRQVYSGMLLATWFKRTLKQSLLGQIYANKAKVKGVDQDPKTNEEIYRQYLRAYKKGVFNFIKEDVDKYTNETIPRKYFSGGELGYGKEDAAQVGHDPIHVVTSLDSAQVASIGEGVSRSDFATVAMEERNIARGSAKKDAAMRALKIPERIRKIISRLRGKAVPQQAVIPAPSTPAKPLSIDRDTSAEDWKEAIVAGKRWHEGIDFKHFFGSSRVLVLGDTNHGLLGIQRALVEHLTELKQAGVTHLGVEIPSDLKVSDIDEISKTVWIPHRFKQLVDLAHQLGIEIVFIDMPESQQKEFKDKKMQSFERGVYMGKFVSKFLHDNPEAVMAVVTGYAHIRDYDQIPLQLDRGGFNAPLVALVSEGQEGFNTLGLPFYFYMMSVVQAIAELTPQNKRNGWVDLIGIPFETRGAVAIVQFARPQPIAPTAPALSPAASAPENQTAVLDVTANLTSLGPINPGAITMPADADYKERVDPHAETWSMDNQHKIIEFVNKLQGITNGQRFYLAVLLISYTENTGRHSLGGSIVDIGFVPQGQFFEITTVDTGHDTYDPRRDYGSLKRHWEISLGTLQEKFGFEDILIKDLSEAPEIVIRNNPDRPLAMMKILLLALTAVKHPERVAQAFEMLSPSALIVFKGEVNKSAKIARLELEDFMLNHLERHLMEASKWAYKTYQPLSSLATFFNVLLKPSELAPEERQKLEAIRDALQEAYRPALDLKSKTDLEIFWARSRLAYLNNKQSKLLIGEIDDFITRAEEVLRQVEQYASKKKNFPAYRWASYSATAGTEMVHAWYALSKLGETRRQISAYPMLPANAAKYSPLALTTQMGIAASRLNDSVVPLLAEGAVRYRFFTGRIDQKGLNALLSDGIDMKGFGKGGLALDWEDIERIHKGLPKEENGWTDSKEDFDDYMFREWKGALGYIIFVDIPESVVASARAMGGNFMTNFKKLVSTDGKLKTEFIIGAVDQRNGQWVDKAQAGQLHGYIKGGVKSGQKDHAMAGEDAAMTEGKDRAMSKIENKTLANNIEFRPGRHIVDDDVIALIFNVVKNTYQLEKVYETVPKSDSNVGEKVRKAIIDEMENLMQQGSQKRVKAITIREISEFQSYVIHIFFPDEESELVDSILQPGHILIPRSDIDFSEDKAKLLKEILTHEEHHVIWNASDYHIISKLRNTLIDILLYGRTIPIPPKFEESFGVKNLTGYFEKYIPSGYAITDVDEFWIHAISGSDEPTSVTFRIFLEGISSSANGNNPTMPSSAYSSNPTLSSLIADAKKILEPQRRKAEEEGQKDFDAIVSILSKREVTQSKGKDTAMPGVGGKESLGDAAMRISMAKIFAALPLFIMRPLASGMTASAEKQKKGAAASLENMPYISVWLNNAFYSLDGKKIPKEIIKTNSDLMELINRLAAQVREKKTYKSLSLKHEVLTSDQDLYRATARQIVRKGFDWNRLTDFKSGHSVWTHQSWEKENLYGAPMIIIKFRGYVITYQWERYLEDQIWHFFDKAKLPFVFKNNFTLDSLYGYILDLILHEGEVDGITDERDPVVLIKNPKAIKHTKLARNDSAMQVKKETNGNSGLNFGIKQGAGGKESLTKDGAMNTKTAASRSDKAQGVSLNQIVNIFIDFLNLNLTNWDGSGNRKNLSFLGVSFSIERTNNEVSILGLFGKQTFRLVWPRMVSSEIDIKNEQNRTLIETILKDFGITPQNYIEKAKDKYHSVNNQIEIIQGPADIEWLKMELERRGISSLESPPLAIRLVKGQEDITRVWNTGTDFYDSSDDSFLEGRGNEKQVMKENGITSLREVTYTSDLTDGYRQNFAYYSYAIIYNPYLLEKIASNGFNKFLVDPKEAVLAIFIPIKSPTPNLSRTHVNTPNTNDEKKFAEPTDEAMLTKGGIDLNAANLNFRIKRDGNGVPLPLAQQDLAQLSNIEGLDPVILSIKPASQTLLFSQLQTSQ